MNPKVLLLIAFIAMVGIQLYFPARMIWGSEQAIKTGKEFKFKVRAKDPYDPFRGKYVTLNFFGTSSVFEENEKLEKGDEVFATFKIDQNGYAVLDSIYINKPQNTDTFLKTSINSKVSIPNNKMRVSIALPFEKYFLEEGKAYAVEQAYNDALRQNKKGNYAVVYLHKGNAVMNALFIANRPAETYTESDE